MLVRPINTPITPLCTSLTTLTWEHVKNAGTFRDAINTFDAYASEDLVPKDAGPSANPTFAFVTLTPWDLRVQLPREARDKNVVLPPYLQHPVLFGLRGEYQTFQSHHPETLAFSSTSLSSICAGLEVEEVRSSGKVTGGLPFHLQALAPSSPRRALEEALTLTRCLNSLLTKSRPSQANPQGTPDVLQRPIDARSDVRAFLGERSKVLHLSGLPHDTTQSELESWFTQYGGRPIAFWTLRAPEGGKPSGSGFVVFGSHEEVSLDFFYSHSLLRYVNLPAPPRNELGKSVRKRVNEPLTNAFLVISTMFHCRHSSPCTLLTHDSTLNKPYCIGRIWTKSTVVRTAVRTHTRPPYRSHVSQGRRCPAAFFAFATLVVPRIAMLTMHRRPSLSA